MARGLFTLRQQVQGIVQKAWNTPVGTYAGSFNGSSQYLSLPSIAAYTLSADFTIEFWVNATSYPSTGGGSPTVLSGTNTLNNWLVLVDSGTIAFYWNQTEIVSGGTTNIVGSWFHVSVVRSGSTVTIYKNGTRLNSATNASSFTLTSPLFIGQQNTGVGYWAGLISNVRIVKGTAVYTQNFAPPTTPLAAITNTSLLTLQNATIIDNSTNAATITNGGSVTTLAAMPFTQLKTPAVDYLVVAGGGGADTGGGGAGGLLQGTVPVTAGSSITVTVGGGGTGNITSNGQNSVFGSISATGGGQGSAGVNNYQPDVSGGAYSGGSGGGAYQTSVPGNGTVGQGNKGGNAGTSGASSTAGGGGGAGAVGLNTLVLYTGANGGAGISSAISGTVTAYAGGGAGGGYQSVGVGGAGGGGNAGVAGSTNTGGGGGGYVGISSITGKAGGSGIVIVSYPDIYAGATSTTGSPTVSTSGSGSISLNGTNQYLTIPTNAALNFGTGDFTIEGWVYPNTSNDWFLISSTGSGGMFFGYRTTPAFAYGWGRTGVAWDYNAGAKTNGVWQHIAVSRSGTNMRIFLDGVQQGTTQTNSTAYDLGTTSTSIGSQGAALYFSNYLTNLRVVKGTALYTSNFTPSTTPLTAVSGTSLLLSSVSGAPFVDSSGTGLVATAINSPTWNQASPFATGLGYKNRVYTWTSSGSITF